MLKICLIDVGSGNIGSLSNMLNYLKIKHVISNNSEDINNSSHYILPGVGSFKNVMENLSKKISIKNLEKNVFKKQKPILGICVGMQIFAKFGYEDEKTKGLNWIDGEVKKLNNKMLPHMGWNNVKLKFNNKFFQSENDEFYFVHSYHFLPKKKKNLLGITNYGVEFCSSIIQENIIGVQFHPEKSQTAGLNLIKNFCK